MARSSATARPAKGAATVSLDHLPISTSLGAALDGEVLPRSRSQGFDYDEATRGLLLVGKPPPAKSQLVVSYRTWEQVTCE